MMLAVFCAVLLWSAWLPYDLFTWGLEVFPALIGLALLTYTYKRFPFTRMLYVLMLIHAVILMVGGHYTYARVPAFEWLRHAFDLTRNHYDRLGHLAQGFIPAMVAREILIRLRVVRTRPWLFFIVTSICLALSALYELLEWGVAVASGTAAEDFLGTQGDVWDTQTDMAMCLVGAILAQLTLTRIHDRKIAEIEKQEART